MTLAELRSGFVAQMAAIITEAKGRTLSPLEAREFDFCAGQVEWIDAIILNHQNVEPIASSETSSAPQEKIPTTPKVRTTTREDTYLNVFGKVGRLCGEVATHSSLDGGYVSGWHPDIVPFWEMEEVPGPGRPFLLQRAHR